MGTSRTSGLPRIWTAASPLVPLAPEIRFHLGSLTGWHSMKPDALSWRVDHQPGEGTTETRWCYQPNTSSEPNWGIGRYPLSDVLTQWVHLSEWRWPLLSHNRGRRRHLLAMGQRLCRSKWFGHLSPKGAAQRQGFTSQRMAREEWSGTL